MHCFSDSILSKVRPTTDQHDMTKDKKKTKLSTKICVGVFLGFGGVAGLAYYTKSTSNRFRHDIHKKITFVSNFRFFSNHSCIKDYIRYEWILLRVLDSR